MRCTARMELRLENEDDVRLCLATMISASSESSFRSGVDMSNCSGTTRRSVCRRNVPGPIVRRNASGSLGPEPSMTELPSASRRCSVRPIRSCTGSARFRRAKVTEAEGGGYFGKSNCSGESATGGRIVPISWRVPSGRMSTKRLSVPGLSSRLSSPSSM